ncbi:MAG: hypothetical protein FJ405_07705 [Verrucomicrobia bacterium]|nr:hypothetical protein [Verrucomicrobiota bacterium]
MILRPFTLQSLVPLLCVCICSSVQAQGELDAIRRELEQLRTRVTALEQSNHVLRSTLEVDRLVVRKELIVSDTGSIWEKGFDRHQIPRGIYARSLFDGPGGLWVRSRLIKCEVDDPFDDRFHAIERDGRIRSVAGHISWNVWAGDAWRQVAIVQGEALEPTEMPAERWDGDNHPGRLRFQSFRPHHGEPLTDALLGQGKMSLGGGGFGGGGLPLPQQVLELWGGSLRQNLVAAPSAPRVARHDASGRHTYTLVAVGADGALSTPSPEARADGYALLDWDSVPGGDAYIVIRDGVRVAGPLRKEGSVKRWRDPLLREP